MTPSECGREPDVLALALTGRWPSGCDEELRAHVGGCASCRETALAASALQTEHDAIASVRVPSSGASWWRVQRRARQEAARTAARAAVAVQAVSLACGGAVALGVLRVLFRSVDWSRWTGTARELLAAAATMAQIGLPFTIAIVACLAFAPVAVYLAVRE